MGLIFNVMTRQKSKISLLLTKCIHFLFSIFLIFSFWNVESVDAQTKYSNSVKKGKYHRIAKKIDRELSKNPDDILLNYYKANLLINKMYQNYNPEEAYKYLNIAKFNWDNLTDENERKELKKNSIASLINNCLATIHFCAFQEVVSNSKTIEDHQRFLDYYTLAPNSYRTSVTEGRNALAYQKALEINTEESFQKYIDTYPDAKQIPLAINKRDESGFKLANEEGTSEAFKKFLIKYPDSKLYKTAFDICYILENFEYDIRKNNSSEAVLDWYKKFTNDGEKITLDLFFNWFSGSDLSMLSERRDEDYRIATLGEQLLLHVQYDTNNFQKYDEYIRLAAPREKAFVALQRMISPHIDKKEWKDAIYLIKRYLLYWNDDHTKLLDLISILEKEENESVKIVSVDAEMNTSTGSVYNPVHLSRTNTLYFGGKNRQDNIGGEDIFEAIIVENRIEGVKLASGTSLKDRNEVPLNISTDGLEMLIFRDGKIVCLERMSIVDQWNETSKYAELNDLSSWASDAMLANGGKALLFTSNMPGGKNLHHLNEGVTFFHGDMQYQSDIYVMVQDSSGQWGNPINLGDSINTPYSERTPFLHHDNKTLYFSSDGHGGLGRMDVYKSVRLRDDCWDCWSAPINMGKEINTSGDDIGFKITEDGKKAYFSKDEAANPPSSLILLLDVSGSMAGRKIEALKQATKKVCITGIQNNAEISIIAFNGICYEPIHSGLNFTKNYDEINNFIDKIVANGGTPMYEAYSYACNVMSKYSSDTKNKMIILMTDGEANGCSELDDVLRQITYYQQLYKTQTIGFDVEENSIPYNDLHKISEATGGKYFHASQPNDLGAAFENAIKELYDMGLNSSKKGIYTFNIPEEFRPEKVVHLTGNTLNRKGEGQSVEIRVVDLTTHKEVYRTKSNPEDGGFYFVLPLGKIYGFYVEDISIYPISDHIDLRNVDIAMNITKNIPLITIDEIIKNNIAVTINNLFFDFDKSDILPLSVPELKLHAKIIKSKNYHVDIKGYTDSIGSDMYNLNLSQKRADAVKEYLIKEGCTPSKLTSIGHGIRRIDTNETEEGRARNRRVELVFRKSEN